jgi:uncharacterized membrane protein HdeD (DUF308 family)
MLWSGSSPLAVVRAGMWGFLLFAGAAWLAIAWSVLRLQPADIVHVAGPVVLFGALTEAVRALSGTRTWWLNAGMAALFAVTGAVLLADQDSSFTTPAALLGWYLMVRGAADVAVSMMTRESDRIWGLLMVVGVLETGLGFFAASPLSRSADLVVTVLGGLALTRGVADLVAALRLREAAPAAPAGLLELPPERAAGVAGYSAGLDDYASAPSRSRSVARHRAPGKSSRPGSPAAMDVGDWSVSTGGIGPVRSPGQAVAGGMAGAAGFSPGMGESVSADWTPAPEWTGPVEWPGAAPHGPARATPDRDAAGQSEKWHGETGPDETGPGETRPDETGYAETGHAETGHAETGHDKAGHDKAGHDKAGHDEAGHDATGHDATGHGATGHATSTQDSAARRGTRHAAAHRSAARAPSRAESFHDEVVRTTADLDAMLALAGVTGAAVSAGMVHYEAPEVPDTPEGVEQSDTAEMGVVSER